MKPVIICGGVGTKMWPASRQKMPKHFLSLVKGKSLFQLNWAMLRKKYKPEEIFLQTNALQAEIAKGQVTEIVAENIFIEPEMRNQGPATGFAAAMLARKGFGDEPFMLIQSDLLRQDEKAFLHSMEMADEIAQKENVYVTGAMKPAQIVEGVDYLVKGDLITEEDGIKLWRIVDYVDRTEKEKIRSLMDSGNLLLHWNHTAMTPNNLLAMFKKYKPEWSQPTTENYAELPKGGIEEVTARVYKDGGAVAMEFPFEIVDFGTWESVAKYLGSDENNNYIRSKKYTAVIGLTDIVVVETEDALLICKKDQSGRVGEVVEKLKAEGKTELV